MAARQTPPQVNDTLRMVSPMDIFVFRTNIPSADNVQPIARRLDDHERVARWTIDFGDRDKVLRVEAVGADPGEITRLVTSAGFECEEMV
jgi:hypothetical protein